VIKPNKIFIICNGSLSNKKFHKSVLKDADIIICADGGANNAAMLGVTPDFIIGDMDSIKTPVMETYAKAGKTEIILDKNQDKTDTELAIELAESLRPKEIIILCAIGTRIDHVIANVLCLDRISKKIKARIIDDKNEVVMVKNDYVDVYGKKGNIVSVIPLTNIKGLTYQGLKWPLKNKNLKFNWFGICNVLTKKRGKVSVKQGKILVIKSKD